MKVEEATDTIAKFFNDLIGAWVPGAVLAVGLALMHLGPTQVQSVFKLGDSTSTALTFAGLLFAIGHALLALHEQILNNMLPKVGFVKPFDEAGAKKRQSYEWFAELVKAQQTGAGAKDWGYDDLRSLALSVSAAIDLHGLAGDGDRSMKEEENGVRRTTVGVICGGGGMAYPGGRPPYVLIE